MPPRIYLDTNSTTPMLPAVAEAMRPFFGETFANPASAHRSGAAARRALEAARESVASCVHAHPDEVIFTSGATEANNLAIFGLAGRKPGAIVVSPVEHPSVIQPCEHLAANGHSLSRLTVDAAGKVVTESLSAVLGQRPVLVAVQSANHETGTVQDIGRLVELSRPAPFHTDATQAIGKISVDFHKLRVTTLSCSAHKLHGPKGIGALVVARGTNLDPLLYGGHQQRGLRPGTEPVALAVGFATALRLACEEMDQRRSKCLALRERFLAILQEKAQPLVINGDPRDGLVHTINISFPGCPGDLLLIRLDLAGIDCSTGSACSSGSLLPSPVLEAMQCPPEVLRSAMRFSLNHLLSMEVIEEAARRIAREVEWLRGAQKKQLSANRHV